MQASVRELKNHLNEMLHRVQHGEELIVTSHKQAIAKITPITTVDVDISDDRATLFAELDSLDELHKRSKTKTSAVNTVVKMREEERS